MKILVTGGNGLVGSAIKRISNNYSQYKFIFLSSKDCDLTIFEKVFEYFSKIKPDIVIHLAANVGGLFKNLYNKVSMFEKNILINMNVLKVCHELGVKKLISCLSTCIFPDNITYPINETMLQNGPPHYSNDSYSYAKRMLDVQSKAYREQYGNNFMCIIPTNIYGSNDNYNLEDAHVIPALIHKCFIAKKNNETFIVSGSGKPLRQFIYSDDLASLILWILENVEDNNNLIISVSENEEISIKEVALEIAKCFNYEQKILFDETKPDGQYKKTADNTKLMNLYKSKKGHEFKFKDFKLGIKESVEWFKLNYEIARK